MTMHNRGETQGLTIGTAAVFRSGPSPRRARHSDGSSPDRTREGELRDEVARIEGRLVSALNSSKDGFSGVFFARLEARIESDLSPSRFLIFDRDGPVFCITDRESTTDCPRASEERITMRSERIAFPDTKADAAEPPASPRLEAPPPTKEQIYQRATVAPEQAPAPTTPESPSHPNSRLIDEPKLGALKRADTELRDVTFLASASASSVLPEDLGYTFGPHNVLDGTLDTSWQPSAKRQRGVGEWIELRFERPQLVARIDVANGFQSVFRRQDLFVMNARLHEAQIILDSNIQTFVFERGQRGFVSIPVEPPVLSTFIRIRAVSVYQGTRWPDLALSEIRLFARVPRDE
jgi:hypothetical protein